MLETKLAYLFTSALTIFFWVITSCNKSACVTRRIINEFLSAKFTPINDASSVVSFTGFFFAVLDALGPSFRSTMGYFRPPLPNREYFFIPGLFVSDADY